MWGYIALSRLARGPAETQLALATAIGHDKTRLIGVLGGLEADGLITREPDPNDRRARLVRITPRGAERHAAAVTDIRAMEDKLLAGLTADQRDTLLAVLPILTVS
jgi:DNA-binding MarR family transcriptional regulator